MTREGVLNQIETLLTTITTPIFEIVYRAEPLSIPTGQRVIAFWYEGDEFDPRQATFGQANPYERFLVRAYWRVQVDAAVREGLELEVWNATRAIKAALRSDQTLSGHCQDLICQDAETGYVDLGASKYRSVQVPVRVLMADQELLEP